MRSLRMQPRPTRDPLLTLGGDCGRGGGSDGQLTGGGKQPAAVACESVLLSYPSLQPRPVYICLVCHTPVPVSLCCCHARHSNVPCILQQLLSFSLQVITPTRVASPVSDGSLTLQLHLALPQSGLFTSGPGYSHT